MIKALGRRGVYAISGSLLLLALALVVAWPRLPFAHAQAPTVDFNRDIRPILNQNCLACHGGVKQAGGVSFLYRDEALGTGKSGRPTVIPGNPAASELIARVISRDPDYRMPLHGPPLTDAQVALLRQWIKEGALWQDYWAFVPPKAQPQPAVRDRRWVRGPIDAFVLARLEKEGLRPAPEAGREALLRRVSLDLTGLPPTPDEIAGFLADKRPGAYERQVDRLLASPHYGERWAAMWLDLARYADSKGYEKDLGRTMWPYRDWVVNAFNRDLPYDRFVVTQIAGDLLPGGRMDDRIATAFQRQTPVNDEDGTDDEEYRLVAAMDRSATTFSVLNGLTMNCVQCHSHPYDPIRHRDYYKFLAFYNTTQDADLVSDAPRILVPVDAARRPAAWALQSEKRQRVDEIVAAARAIDARTRWARLPIRSARVGAEPALRYLLGRLDEQLRDPVRYAPIGESPEIFARNTRGYRGDVVKMLQAAQSKPVVSALKIVDGRAEQAGTVPSPSVFDLATGGAATPVRALRIEVAPKDAKAARNSPEDGFIVDRIEAWVTGADGRDQPVRFARFLADSPADVERSLQATPYDSFARSGGQGGFSAESKLGRLHWIIAVPDRPIELARGAALKVRLTQTQDVGGKPGAPRRVALSVSDDPRWQRVADDTTLPARFARLVQLRQALGAIPSVALPVMAEQAAYDRRDMMEFERGNFLTKTGPVLTPDVPGLFPPLPAGARHNRLAMARWFFAPGQPLTARVAVNRFWEQLFGTGIVETLEDFGSAGQMPSHPELLDWLALHFQNDLRWQVKPLLREIVTSATYRQSAAVSPAMARQDPRNRLLSHGPQQRLTAEMVRDQAMVASGLFDPALGGPPVMPPQPDGVWASVYNEEKWVDATGPSRYRRAVYTYIKRSAIYPSLAIFDAAPHDVSLPRRTPTNTPLQALVTLNDPVYREAAIALAQRMREAPGALAAQINFGARCVLSRDLSAREIGVLVGLHARSGGSAKAMAGYTAVATALLNLDAAMTR